MIEATMRHAPRWEQEGENWLLIVGNRTVARLEPVSDPNFPQYRWVSCIDDRDLDDHGWHAVDFVSLKMAQLDIGEWWKHLAKGQRYTLEADQ